MHAAETAFQLLERGNLLFGAGDRAAAADCYHRALQLDPALHAARYNLGCTLDVLAGPAQALPHFQEAVAHRPDWWQARCNLGFALARVGRMAEAAGELEAAARLNPEDPGIRNDLGLALSALGQGDGAHASFQEAIRLNPDYPEAHNNLAILFERYGRSSEAIASCYRALALRPDYPEAHLNLGNALKAQGRHQEALVHYREALRLRPDFPEAASSLLFTLCYPSGISRESLFHEHAAYGVRYHYPVLPHDNDPAPLRPLRIGYLSADFRSHAVARFIEPVLRHHDRKRYQVHLYSNVAVPDATTARLGEVAGRLVNLAGVPDREAAELIRRDRIDLLVDLSGHTADNRLLLMARRPAPIQLTWLGYPETTGLESIDYRITDACCDPPGDTERLHTERLLRLPQTFSCFAPPEDAPPVGPLPALARGSVTFGSFNNPAKITEATVALWAGVLDRVPGSRMLVKGYSLADQGSRDRLASLFAAHGIGAERLVLQGNTPGYREHLQLYGEVDLALDTFPYHGTTTTCEALWMGVPVLTLVGNAHRSRVGATLLTSVGLTGLVAATAEEFVERAAGLAGDLPALARLRGTLRERMAAAPLTDGAGFTRQLEAAYRQVWQSWCAKVREAGHAADPGIPARLASPIREAGPLAAAVRTPEPPNTPLRAKLPPMTAGEYDAAQALTLLQEGQLDLALSACLAALRSDPSSTAALAGMEETLNRQMAADLSAACRQDALRLGHPAPPLPGEAIQDETLEEAAALLLERGLLTPAELICRYLVDRGYRGRKVSHTLGEIAMMLGLSGAAASYFQEAVDLGDGRHAMIQLLKAKESARYRPDTRGERKFLLIKAWGYGFWSDVSHLLGQCLLAEMTGRIPVVHWGGNSLFSDSPDLNAFESFFLPVSAYTQKDLAASCRSFYPPKWHAGNLTLYGINQCAGPWSRCSSLHALARGEDVVASDFHYAVHDLVPWIDPGHELYGLSTDQVYLYLFRRYLKVQPAIAAQVETFYQERMAGYDHLALHIRGGDKGEEDPNLELVNALYPAEIDRHLERYPDDRLLLLTDDAGILASYRQRYGERVIHTGATRTSTGAGVHYQKQESRYRLGEEVLVDALLATRCRSFVGNGLSNVSCAVAQMKEWPAGSCRLLGARMDRLRQFTLYRS